MAATSVSNDPGTPARELAVTVMRACPIHLGHQAVLDTMVADAGVEQCIMFLGSSNRQLSFKYMFSLRERHALVQTLYPDLRVLGLPDFHDDELWLFNLDQQLDVFGASLESVTFYGGCHEDIEWFIVRDLRTKIINRFDGHDSPVISATQVRDALLERRALDGLVDPQIHRKVRTLFDIAMDRLKKL